jgi:GTPase involved in cell partitioning and DNA repair
MPMRRIRLPQLGAVIAICALVGAIAGIAGSAAAPSKKKSAKSANSARPHFGLRDRGGPGHGPGGPGVHSESVVLNKAGDGFITVTADAGKVKSVGGSDITIDESVGTVHYKDVTVTIPDGATVIRNHAKAALSDIKADDFVRVISSSEETVVIAEDAAFQKQERRHFDGHGPGGPGGPGGPPPGFGA